MNKRILVVFASREGQTEKIAGFIAEKFAGLGCEANVFNVATMPRQLAIESYDGVVVGGPLHLRRYPPELRTWIEENASRLRSVSTAFFTVCLGVLSSQDKVVEAELHNIADHFFWSVGWLPDSQVTFAGALKYSKYGWLTKRIMRRIAKKEGRTTDMKKDYEYTNWEEVRTFVEKFAKTLQMSRVVTGESAGLRQNVLPSSPDLSQSIS